MCTLAEPNMCFAAKLPQQMNLSWSRSRCWSFVSILSHGICVSYHAQCHCLEEIGKSPSRALNKVPDEWGLTLNKCKKGELRAIYIFS
ncbi:hypothetical protein CEXT_667321 [Caerostris extrusa]|uniref:Uncharacterized protein n=1 Tax=Caerostris extrusa TaxID=172846 RepID=A0AAV4UWG6_CAEEX|nr:hypothetical protein CEXT_667321 [Caerostris extrusa]